MKPSLAICFAFPALVLAVEPPGTQPARADIVIATAGPMSGTYAAFGDQMQVGARFAVADLNETGGVLGEELRLLVGDDACDSRRAQTVANQLVNDGVLFVAGHYCSHASIPASRVYTEQDVLQISPASTSPVLTDEGGDNVFRVCGRDDKQGVIAAQYIAEHYRHARIAVVHDGTAYGQGLADATRTELRAIGLREVLYEAYVSGESDYSTLVSRLNRASIDVLYVGGYHTEAGLMVRQMREQGMDTQLISGDALITQEFWTIAGEAGEGTLMTFGPEPRENPAAADVVRRFREWGYEPEGYTLYTYAAIQVFAQAAEIAGSTQIDELIEALRTNTFETVIGDLSFDEKGDIRQPAYVWYAWADGTYATVGAGAIR